MLTWEDRQHIYHIKNKDKKTIPFKENRIQEYIKKCIYFRKKDNKPLRFNILKARQMGCTTWFALRHLDRAHWRSNQLAAIIAHHQKNVKVIFEEIIRYPYDHIPVQFRKKAYHDSTYQLSWREQGSSIIVQSEGSGITPNMLHATEVARMRRAKEILGQAQESVPKNGIIVLETTANGRTNYFYNVWQATKEDPDSIYENIFLKWWYMDEYEYPVPEDFVLTEQEKDLLQKFQDDGLRPGHLVFRRHKIKEGLSDRIDTETGLSGELLFMQNYPMTEEEAFIIKQGSIFNITNLYQLMLEAPKSLEIKAVGKGFLKIYLEKIETDYIIIVDPSEGKGKDSSSVHVMETNTRRVVATLHGKFITKELTRYLAKLGNFYNNALLVIERNKGEGILNLLLNSQEYWYSNVYYHTGYNKYQKGEPGFPTSELTRNLFINDLMDAVEEMSIYPDLDTINEMLNFGVPEGKTKIEAITGHDDRVISLAIGNHLCLKLGRTSPVHTKTRKPIGIF